MKKETNSNTNTKKEVKKNTTTKNTKTSTKTKTNTKKEPVKKEVKEIKETKKVNTKIKKDKWDVFMSFVSDNKRAIYGFILGLLIGLLILVLVWPDRIAELKDGTQPVVTFGKNTITADDLYSDMKEYYSVNVLLDTVDSKILEKKYPTTSEMTESVEENAQYYLNLYKENYNYTEEEFLSANGFKDYDAFIDYLTLDHRRNLYVEDYLEDQISDEEIKKYYDENVFGDINCKHILVKTSDDVDADTAKATAEEIIKKLNDGATFDEVKEEYKDTTTYEDLGYQAWNSDLEDSFMNALKEMKDESYSTEPVETSYGYHVIYRIDQKDKASLKKSKENIIEEIKTDMKSEDSNISYKALIKMREDAGLTFIDSGLKSKYKTYKKKYE